MTKMKKLMTLAALMAGASLMSAPASAAACETNDVWSNLNGGTDFADSCYGLGSGNITESGTFAYTTVLGGTGWAPYTSGGWSLLGGVTYNDAGTWSVNGYLGGDLMLIMKQASEWGAWYLAAPNLSDGGYQVTGFTGGGFDLSHAFALQRVSVPEPATLGLMGLGLLGMGLIRRRRKA